MKGNSKNYDKSTRASNFTFISRKNYSRKFTNAIKRVGKHKKTLFSSFFFVLVLLVFRLNHRIKFYILLNTKLKANEIGKCAFAIFVLLWDFCARKIAINNWLTHIQCLLKSGIFSYIISVCFPRVFQFVHDVCCFYCFFLFFFIFILDFRFFRFHSSFWLIL